MDIRQLLNDINQLLLDLENTTDDKDKEIYKSFIQLKLRYISGLVKNI
jgi:hypothetical protein